MKPTIRTFTGIFMLSGALALCLSARAQQTTQTDARNFQAYDQRREVNLIGTVVKFESASTVPPVGAHVLLQTASGQVDVHLGNAKVLQANHLELSAGDTVRVVGENLKFSDGTAFVVRTLQRGSQTVTLRSKNGMPLVNTTVPNKSGNAVAQSVSVR